MPLALCALIALAWVVAAIVAATALIAAIAWLGVLGVLDVTAVGAGNSLHLLAGAVDTGDLDGGVGQLVLQVNRWGKDDAAG